MRAADYLAGCVAGLDLRGLLALPLFLAGAVLAGSLGGESFCLGLIATGVLFTLATCNRRTPTP